MHRRNTHPPDDLRIALANTLGFPDYPVNTAADPYLNYISNRHIGRGTLEEYLCLFIRVVEHFKGHQVDVKGTPRPNSIQALLDRLGSSENDDLFADTKAGSSMRKEDVEDTVMYILGAWTMMLSSFVQLPNGFRKVITAYNVGAQMKEAKGEAHEEDLSGLIKGSRLLPKPGTAGDARVANPDDEMVQTAIKLVALLSGTKVNSTSSNSNLRRSSNPALLQSVNSKMSRSQVSYRSLDDMDSIESLSVKATRLNAFTLNVLGAVEISWTHNISRHMLLSRHGGRHILEVFAIPCVFKATTLTSDAVNISSELAQEIQESYCILFNAWPKTPLHAKLGLFLGLRKFCWCWSCSAYRYRDKIISKYKKSFYLKSRRAKRCRDANQRSEFDPLLVELMNNNESSDWTHDLFPCLWSRITILEEHLQAAKPWSIWILFRDRRDTLQFWTFL